MTSYTCPEFAATGLEVQILEEQVRREEALRHGWTEVAEQHEAEMNRLWAELAELAERYPLAA